MGERAGTGFLTACTPRINPNRPPG